MSTQAIGFAGKFYTLWTIDRSEVYTTDVNGNHHLTGYDTRFTYNKNISMDLEKAKSLHPTLDVIEDLKGKRGSWTQQRSDDEDLCPQIMKFGKYHGHNIDELLEEDFDYVMWICDNRGGTPNGIYASSTKKVIDHKQALEDESNKKVSNYKRIFTELLEKGFHEFTAESNLRVYESMAYMNLLIDGLSVEFRFFDSAFKTMYYNGHEYGLPCVQVGKKYSSKRIKGKKLRFDFEEDKSEVYTVKVTKVTML